MSRTEDLAVTLHAAAIYLLRAARADDPRTGLSPARLSALSVIVFAGPLTLSGLARQEQVSRPAISQMVAGLEDSGLVRRKADPADGRRQLLEATADGRRLLEGARRRRVRRISTLLNRMNPEDRRALGRGILALSEAFSEPA